MTVHSIVLYNMASRFSAVYQCNSCATDSHVDLSKTELVFRLQYGPDLVLLGISDLVRFTPTWSDLVRFGNGQC